MNTNLSTDVIGAILRQNTAAVTTNGPSADSAVVDAFCVGFLAGLEDSPDEKVCTCGHARHMHKMFDALKGGLCGGSGCTCRGFVGT